MGRNNLNNSMEHVLPSKNLEKNALLKIPNFTLQDVEFLEELGEGAFGKMMISIIIIHEFSRTTDEIYNIFTNYTKLDKIAHVLGLSNRIIHINFKDKRLKIYPKRQIL